MKTAVLLFTYNRPDHTKMVLSGLKNNTKKVDHLFIFQDGKSKNTNEDDWNEVSKCIGEVDWCPCDLVIAEENRGLARSIVSGIKHVTKIYESFIVLEDDCVPHPLFMEYMVGALNRYKSEKTVFCINGYSGFDSIDIEREDTYFSGRASSWGWATWRDRWEMFEEDYRILNRIKSDKRKLEWFHIWGEDLENHLYGNIDGRCDSWAVFWALKAIENRLLCLTPSRSLINNVGMDGTGRHKVIAENMNPSVRNLNDLRPIKFSNQIAVRDDVIFEASNRFAFTPEMEKQRYYNTFLYNYIRSINKGVHLHDIIRNMGIRELFIWGCGKYFDLIVNDLKEGLIIRGIIESEPSLTCYDEYDIIPCSQIEDDSNILVIPGYDMSRIRRLICKKRIGMFISITDVLDESGEYDC